VSKWQVPSDDSSRRGANSNACQSGGCCQSPTWNARRGAHGAAVNSRLLGMKTVLSEDAVRRGGLAKIDEAAGRAWLRAHLDY
jgi:hypothetical protein